MKNPLRQRKVEFNRFSKIVGGTFQTYSNMAVPLSMYNTAMLSGLFFVSVMKQTPWLAWIDIRVFIAVVVIGWLVTAAIFWVFILPHIVAYGNWIAYQHGNIIREDIELLSKKVDKLTEEKENGNKNEDNSTDS